MQQKACKSCGTTFAITSDDIELLQKLQPRIGEHTFTLPVPDDCPECRQQQRAAFRNRRYMYRRTCDATGKTIFSMYSPDKPFKIYENQYNEAQVDATNYGRDIDRNKSFFTQMKELQLEVPRNHAAVITETMENADYVNGAHHVKDSYLSCSVVNCEQVYYCEGIYESHQCFDCYHIHHCSLCYECVESTNLHHCSWMQYCEQCNNSHFCMECKGCSSCFGCVGLDNKSYCIYNKQYTKEQYQSWIQKLQRTPKLIQDVLHKLQQLRESIPHEYARLINTENCIGNDLINAKNCYHTFGSGNCEELRYCYFLNGGATTCMDALYFGDNLERTYRSVSTGSNSQNLLFCLECYDQVSDLIYCDSCCNNVKNCLGCIGLRNKQYCILNKQYSKEQYLELAPKLIQKMQSDGEWGKFFPITYSPFGYNESLANEHFPLSEQEARTQGYHRMSESYHVNIPQGIETIAGKNGFEGHSDEEMLSKAILCEVTNEPFRIIKQELAFYKKMGIPLPTKHPQQRHKERFAKVLPKKLRHRQCANCAKEVLSPYTPERKEKIVCNECYH